MLVGIYQDKSIQSSNIIIRKTRLLTNSLQPNKYTSPDLLEVQQFPMILDQNTIHKVLMHTVEMGQPKYSHKISFTSHFQYFKRYSGNVCNTPLMQMI